LCSIRWVEKLISVVFQVFFQIDCAGQAAGPGDVATPPMAPMPSMPPMPPGWDRILGGSSRRPGFDHRTLAAAMETI
jgi:hypothetical protein